MLTNENYQEVLDFLEAAVTETKKAAKEKRDIDQKAAFYNHAKKIQETRNIMLTLKFSYADYVETGKYEAPIRIGV